MEEKWITLITVFVLGILCPCLLLSAVSVNRDTEPITSVTQGTGDAPDQQSQTQAKELTISVLDKTGDVIELPMNTYLTAVLLCEMPAQFETEALKAQAVVARTYALRRSEKGTKHEGAAVCMDSACCQGYKSADEYRSAGGTEEAVKKISDAVAATENYVLTYEDQLIEATYFSCSGGRTEDALAVWGSDIPYLRSIQSPGEERAAHFTDTVTFTAKEFAQKLGGDFSGTPESWVESIAYTSGGGVKTIRLCGNEYSGTTVRQLLGLRSTAFVITAVGDTVTITTKGFGHRVGMSQYGADAMAVDGKDYKEILQHYYQGVELVQYVPND